MQNLKNAVIGLSVAGLIAALAWLVVFRTASPCEAMRTEASRLAQLAEDKLIAGSIQASVVESSPGDFSPVECAALAMRMKLEGRSALRILIYRAAPKSRL
jgi:hypothetical protein